MPPATLLHVHSNGAVVSVPNTAVPLRNSTRASWFSGSLAVAAMLMVPGAEKVAPPAGLVSVTTGGSLPDGAVIVRLATLAVVAVAVSWLVTARPT